jgi:hypothetical protein
MADKDVDEPLLEPGEEDVDDPDELDDTALEDLPVDEELLADDALEDPVDEADVIDDEDDDAVVVVVADEEEDEEESEDDEDEVEASLDVILKEKLVVPDEEADDEEAPEQEDRTETSLKVLPKQPDEFVCQSCFLVKHPSQLADSERSLCRDCV